MILISFLWLEISKEKNDQQANNDNHCRETISYDNVFLSDVEMFDRRIFFFVAHGCFVYLEWIKNLMISGYSHDQHPFIHQWKMNIIVVCIIDKNKKQRCFSTISRDKTKTRKFIAFIFF